MFYKSHKWIDIPETTYERRRELRVRESQHTVMIFDKRYQDIDTGKFNFNKLCTLNANGELNYTINAMCDTEDYYHKCNIKTREEQQEKERLEAGNQQRAEELEQYRKHFEYFNRLTQKKEQEKNDLIKEKDKLDLYQEVNQVERVYNPNTGQHIITSIWKSNR